MRAKNVHLSNSINVIKPNYLYIKGGGCYDLNEDNYCELAVVKIHLLQHFLEVASERICNNGEIDGMIFDKEIMDLAEKVFAKYGRYIKAGVDVFEYADYDDPKQMAKFDTRELVCGTMNAGPEEGTEGLPAGWWLDFPGYAHKAFEGIGIVIVDQDGKDVRIGIYENEKAHELGNVKDWIEIDVTPNQALAQENKLSTYAPEFSKEVMLVVEFIAAFEG